MTLPSGGEGISKTELMLLQRVSQGPVSFTHAPLVSGKGTKLVRSSISPSRQKDLYALAVRGYLAHAVTGCGGHGTPPETTVTYTLTSQGRSALGIHPRAMPPVHRNLPLTDEQLAREGIE